MLLSVLVGGALLLLLAAAGGGAHAIHWEHAAQLSDDFRLLWSVQGADMTFEMQVRTHGYVGLGFARSGDGRAAGADVIVGWVDDGQTYFQVSGREIKKRTFTKSKCANIFVKHLPMTVGGGWYHYIVRAV